ncbi:RNA polymerase sigma factor [Streptomyces flaveus]|uniref:RNA polymerase sigma factor n=1 Tax=Streptomyces flaveus TaxID=66370 RepID=A0A917R4M7_9ACTN|nr:RNA polymerase sigma factor [Streptomyces flaveus]GGK88555.1 RNA polymerase sigma factor [Streptomyces flaveus]
MARSARRAHEKDDPPGLADAAEVRRVRAVLALGGVPWDALDDGVQQVRLKLLEEQAKPTRPEVRNRLAWLTVVASRVASDWHRSQSRDAGLRQRLAEHSEEHRVLALAVAEELESMPAAQRQVLVLRYYADLPIREIALLLRVPEGTIKSRLHTAHAAMRARLRQVEVI